MSGNPTGQIVTHTYANGPTSPTITVDLTDGNGLEPNAGSQAITVANVAPTLSALSGPTSTNGGVTKHYTFSISDPGTLDTFSVVSASGGALGTVSNLSLDNVARTGGFDVTFSGTTGSTTLSLQVKDQDGGLSNISTSTVSVSNTFQVIAFQTNPSGFDATFNRPPVLADLNLYDGPDLSDDVPDVVLHDQTTNTNVQGSLVWNAATNTLSFVKTGGILASDSYTATLRSSASGFHDATGHLLDGNGDGNDTQANDNFVTSFTVAPGTGRVLSIKDFARGPGQPVNDTPVAGNSQLAVSLDNAAGLRSVSFTLTYDPTLLTVTRRRQGRRPAGRLDGYSHDQHPGHAGRHRLRHDPLEWHEPAAGADRRQRAQLRPLRRARGPAINERRGQRAVGCLRPQAPRSPAITRSIRMLIWEMSTAAGSTPPSTPP